MTSHRRMLERHSEDELDAVIRWSLQKSVAGNYPPPVVWERIRARVELSAMWRNLRSRVGYRAAMARFSRMGAFLLAEIAFWMRPRYGLEYTKVGVGLDPYPWRYLSFEPGFLWLRLAF
jgi:hypothetical protein